MKRLPCSTLVPFLVTACAGNPGASPHQPSRAESAPKAVARQVQNLAGPRAPNTTPRIAHTEDLDEYQLRMLALAQTQFETFIRQAGSDPRFAEAVKRSREHIDDIETTREFVAAGLAERHRD